MSDRRRIPKQPSTRSPSGRDWTRTGAIAGLAALALGLPAAVVATTDLFNGSADSAEAPAEVVTASVEAGAGHEMGCADAGDDSVALIAGGLQVAKNGAYTKSVEVAPGDRVTFQLFVHNREWERDVRDLRAGVFTSDEPAIKVPVEARACGSNTHLLRDSASVESTGRPIRLEFVPDTVRIRAPVEGRYGTRGGSDALFRSAGGESLGRLDASRDLEQGFVTVIVAARAMDAG